jgi:hypothetical protein
LGVYEVRRFHFGGFISTDMAAKIDKVVSLYCTCMLFLRGKNGVYSIVFL